MAEIHMEKKTGTGLGWLWILLAVLAVAIVAWLLWPRRVGTTTVTAPTTETIAGAAAPAVPPAIPPASGATIATINQNPEQWVGRQFAGEVTVAEVPTDRGFWIEQNGERMFALVVDEPAEEPIDINPGQRLRIRGTVRDDDYLPQLPGRELTGATEEVIRQEPVYLVADESAIEIIDRPQQSASAS